MECQNCKYYLPENENQGLCRRFPPTLWIHINGPTVSVFPPMMATGYCGEHAKKEDDNS